MKLFVDWDEMYPVYIISEGPRYCRCFIELTEAEYQDWLRVVAEHDAWQERIAKSMQRVDAPSS